MTPPSSPPPESLSRDELERIHRICCRFEDAWKKCLGSADGGPDFATLLVDAPEPERSTLFRELLLVDLEYRRKRGDQPTADEYLMRFPEETKLIGAVFADTLATGEVMKLRCPHCHSPIRLKDDEPDDVLCPSCGSSFRVRDTRLTSSFTAMRQLGKFQLMERLGIGSFGAVWRARDTTLDRIVALKIPHAEQFHETQARDRFQREARAAAQLRHPGIVPVHEIVELETDAGTVPAIVSDFIEGATLRELLETRRVTFREAAGLIAEVAAALDNAHSHGIVHRDLKPANLMIEYPAGLGLTAPLNEDSRLSSTAAAKLTVTKASGTIAQKTTADSPAPVTESDFSVNAAERDSGAEKFGRPRPMILDFGLALRDEQVEATLTIDGQRLGAPAYMSPEQAAGRSHLADRRTDVWALGVILYELLCDDLPFRGSINSLLLQIQFDEPLAPRRVNDKIPFDLETITLKCLAKEPARRYATAGELAADLSRWLRGEPIAARPTGRLERAWRWARRNRRVAALVATVISLLVAISIGSVVVALAINRFAGREVAARELADQRLRQLRVSNDALVNFSTELTRAANLQQNRGFLDQAEQSYRSLIRVYEEFLQKEPSAAEFRSRLAVTYANFAVLKDGIGLRTEAEELNRKAIEIAEALVREYPHESRCRNELAQTYSNLGISRNSRGERREAEEFYQKAISISEPLVHEFPQVPEYADQLATAYINLGNLQQNEQKLMGARQSYQNAIELYEKLHRDHPQKPQYLSNLATLYQNRGVLLHTLHEFADAEGSFQTAVEAFTALVKDHPNIPGYGKELARAHMNLGTMQSRCDKLDQALQSYHRAIAVLDPLVQKHQNTIEFALILGACYFNIGNTYHQRGDPLIACDWFGKAIVTLEGVLERDSRHVLAHQHLHDSFRSRAELLDGLGRHAEAVLNWKKAIEFGSAGMGNYLRLQLALSLARATDHIAATDQVNTLLERAAAIDVSESKQRNNSGLYYDVARVLALATAAAKEDLTLDNIKRSQLTDTYATRAIQLLGQAIAAGFDDYHELRTAPDLAAIRDRQAFLQLLQRRP